MISDQKAKDKYKRALDLIERAQNILSDACQELCPLKGAVDQWEDCGRAYDHVHDLWRRLAYSHVRDIVEMDRD